MMDSKVCWLLATAAMIATLIPTTIAQECEPETATFHASNQTELDSLTGNCTTLLGSIYISAHSMQALELFNITNITGGIELYPDNTTTSIEFYDLEYAESIYILDYSDSSSLRRISLPKLQSVRTIFLQLNGHEPFIDAPVLEDAFQINLIGNWTNVTFKALKEVHDSIEVAQYHEPLWRYDADKTPMDISFPVLEKLNGSLDLTGSISGLSVPELGVITAGGRSASGRVYIRHVGSRLSLSFPKLESIADSAILEGNISRIDLPLLHDLPYLSIYGDIPVSLNASIDNPELINIYGPIESLDFPNLSNFSQITISSHDPFDCNGFKKDLNKATDGSVDDDNYFCDAPSPSSGLSTGGKAGVGVGVGVGGLALLGLGFFLWRRRAKRK